jgi:glycosyltransferase involved in cell wall biosynthesis
MLKTRPTSHFSVSVIIPCRNEADRIGTLLEAVRCQDFPVHEIIVADGGSTDATPAVVHAYRERHPDLRLQWLPVPGVGISDAMNRAIRVAGGDVIVRLDGHSLPRPDYVRQAVETLAQTGAGVVGGIWTIAPGARSRTAAAIALAVAHPMGAGDAAYRTLRADRDRADVDTVPFGCFLKSSWEKLGGFNGALLTNEDYEFNYRMRASGNRVVLDPAIRCTYFARTGYSDLGHQYFRYGWWKGQMLRAHPLSLRWRQAIPASLIPTAGLLTVLGIMWPPARVALAGFLALYAAAITAAAVHISVREQRWDLLAPLAATFATVHWSWGAGVLLNVISVGRWPPWRSSNPAARLC